MDLSKVRNDWLLSRISELSNEMERLYRLCGDNNSEYRAKEVHKDELLDELRKRTELLGDFERLKPDGTR